MEDDLCWRTTFDGRRLWWKTTFEGIQTFIEDKRPLTKEDNEKPRDSGKD